MDQFATGLVGTRSPYGACSSVFDERYISGGSSSGSAVAVARGLVDFSLGTDTAGSGRVPAAFNNLVGLKPSRGLLSTSGVVPACRSLDCISIFAKDCDLARRVWDVARGFDAGDPFSRVIGPGQNAAPWLGGAFRFGVPSQEHLEFFGDDEAEGLYQKALADLEKLGGERVEIDYSIFRAAAALLYAGPWVAERLAAIREFVEDHADEMNPVVREIILGARKYSAVDAFEADYKLRELRRRSEGGVAEDGRDGSADDGHDLYSRGCGGGADQAEYQSRLLHEFCEPARFGGGGGSGGVSHEWAAVWNFVYWTGVYR